MKPLVLVSLIVLTLVSIPAKTYAADKPAGNKNSFAPLADFLLANGTDAKIDPILAAALGLPSVAVPTKYRDADNQAHVSQVVYTVDAAGRKRAVCVYLAKRKISGSVLRNEWFRVALDGKLEKDVVIAGRLDADGRIVVGSGSSAEQAVSSAPVKKSFGAERDFWIKNWLKKQKTAAAPAAPRAP